MSSTQSQSGDATFRSPSQSMVAFRELSWQLNENLQTLAYELFCRTGYYDDYDRAITKHPGGAIMDLLDFLRKQHGGLSRFLAILIKKGQHRSINEIDKSSVRYLFYQDEPVDL